MLATIAVCCLLTCVLTCQPPGTGALSTNPTFSFEVQPPLRWSFHVGASAFPGQPISKAAAQTNFKDDIELAVYKALNSKSIPLSYASNLNVGTNPVDDITIIDDIMICGTAITTEGLLSGNHRTILSICNGSSSSIKYSVKGTIGVKSTVALYESTWKSLASTVQQELTNKGAIFVKPITVKL
ncbi:unnamed protein product, partial [Mesorhabditis belari]|uniref:Uncharacterized protein n=1 Tax=Mesorhabditis belari TaxID=2138241 RepID=A0AAF3F0I1_9BILA